MKFIGRNEGMKHKILKSIYEDWFNATVMKYEPHCFNGKIYTCAFVKWYGVWIMVGMAERMR